MSSIANWALVVSSIALIPPQWLKVEPNYLSLLIDLGIMELQPWIVANMDVIELFDQFVCSRRDMRADVAPEGLVFRLEHTGRDGLVFWSVEIAKH